MSLIFHLAIPCKDLEISTTFYQNGLGGRLARRYRDRVTFNFFGSQLVCHLAPDQIDESPKMYPRHFGITFSSLEDYQSVLNRATQQKLSFFKKPFTRFSGKIEEHQTFFLLDPSNNLIEFKYYKDPSMRY